MKKSCSVEKKKKNSIVHSRTILKQKEAKQAEGDCNWDGFLWKTLTDIGEQLALRQG